MVVSEPVTVFFPQDICVAGRAAVRLGIQGGGGVGDGVLTAVAVLAKSHTSAMRTVTHN